MNKNTSAILSIAAIVLVLAGIGYAVINKNTTPPTSPPVVTNPTSTPPSSGPTSAAPTVITSPTIAPWSSTAVVTGTVNPNGAMTSYWFEYGPRPGSTNRTNTQIIGSGYSGTPTPAYITGLDSNTKYYFRLIAENALGKVEGIQYAFQTTLATPPVGSAPTTQSVAATTVSRNSANLNGKVNPNGAQTSYWFEYGQSNSFGSVTAFQPIGNGTASQNISVSVSGLQPATKYYFRLNAQNQFGTVNGSIINFTTLGPAAPGEPAATTKPATTITSTTATLNGTVNPNGITTDYWFEYGKDSQLQTIIGTASPIGSAGSDYTTINGSADIANLTASTRYYFRVVARNSFKTVRGSILSFKTK